MHGKTERLRVLFQMLSICLCLAAFYLLIADSLNRFKTFESFPTLLSNAPEPQTQFGQGTVDIRTGLFVKDFTDFNIQEDTFELLGNIWFEFNPNIVSLEDIQGFEFDNGQIIEKSLLQTKILKDKLLAVYYVKVRFVSRLVHQHFPFSDHRIFLNLKLSSFAPEDIHFDTNKAYLNAAEKLTPGGWRLQNISAHSGFLQQTLYKDDSYRLVSYPQVIFGFNFQKPGFRRILIILGPSLFLFFFGLLALQNFSDKKIPLTISMGSLTGLLVHRFVIDRLSPDIGYFTIVDYLYLVFLFSTFIVLVFNVYEITGRANQRLKNTLFYGLQMFSAAFFYFLLQQTT